MSPDRVHAGYRGSRSPRRARRLSCIVALLGLLAVPIYAGASCLLPGDSLDEDSFRIVEVQLGQRWRTTLHDALPAYRVGDRLYLPLVELADSLDFPIESTADGRGAEGWFLEPDRRFELDTGACRVRAADTAGTLPTDSALLRDEDIYVPQSLLGTWFPVDLDFDSNSLRLLVEPREPLPIVQRLERQRRWERHGGSRTDRTPEYPRHDIPYRYWDWPFLDATAETRWRRNDEDGTEHRQSRYKLVGAGDFLKLNTQVAVRGSQDESVEDVSLRMGRRDPDGRLLGPLRAREFAFGDIGMGGDPLIARGAVGHGAEVSSFPLHRPQEFDRIDLEGELPLGWDVELYHDGALLDYQSGTDRYDFRDIPLRYGVNRLRLVFYGPQGQVREQVVRRVVGEGMARPGATHLQLAALREDSDRPGIAAAAEERGLLGFQHGISRYLAFGGGVQSLTFDDRRRDYATAEIGLSLPGAFGRLRYASEDGGGEAASFSLLTRLLGVGLSAETARFSDFYSERTLIGGPGRLERRSALRLGSTLPRMGPLWTSLSAEVEREGWTGGDRTELDTRLSLSSYGLRFSHGFELHRTETESTDSTRTRQRLLASTRLGPVRVHAEGTQELKPERYWNHAALGADWRVNPRLTARLDLSHGMQTRVTRAGAGLSWRLDRIALGGSVFGSDDGEYGAGLTISLSAARNPLNGDWTASSRSRTHTGAVAATAYLDENGNGARDPGEPPVPGAEVRPYRSGRSATTDEAGHAFLTGFPAHRDLNLRIDPASLENPFWVPGGEGGLRIVPRPGRVAELELPVMPTGSIDGTLYQRQGGRRRPASGVPLRLVDGNGETVHRTRTAYDGYYSFERIPPGRYRIQAKQNGQAVSQDVTVDGGNLMASAEDLVLRPGGSRPARRPESEQPAPENWILARDPDHYTIQLMAATREPLVLQFAREHGLEDRTAHFRSTFMGEPWFSLLYNDYPTYREAYDAWRELPPQLREARPWIRRFGDVQAIIAADRDRLRLSGVNEATGPWILAQDPNRYTIQLLAAGEEGAVQRFILENELGGWATYFRSQRDGDPWFSVLHGSYPSYRDAAAALRELPPAVREAGPWIRRFGEVHRIIRSEEARP